MLRSRHVLRLVAGLIAMIAFSASTLEVLFPDVHDGDAQSTVVEGTSHGNQGTPVTLPDSPPSPHHSQHIDHCSHAHVATVSTGVSIDDAPVCHDEQPSSSATALVSVAAAPSFRPPIL